MKLAILSNGNANYSTKRLVEEAEKRGHKVKVVKYSGLFYTDGREQIGSQTNEIIEGNKSTQIRFTLVCSL